MMTPDNWDAYEGNDFSVPRHLLADIYRIVLNSLIWDILFSLINNVSAKSLHLCLILCDPMDYGLPGSSVHGDSPGKNTGIGCHGFLQGIFPIQGSNPHLLCLLHCRQIFYCWATGGSPLFCLLQSNKDELFRKVEMLWVTEIELSYISLYRVEKV